MKISELKGRINTVSMGPRFGHFLIDTFIIQFITYFICLIPPLELAAGIQFLIFPAYYIVFEYFYQLTPGKLITNTIVIDDSGNKPDLQTLILRTFLRFVPFEPFSCLDSKSWGWHDIWTKTYVIRRDELPKIREILGLTENDINNNVYPRSLKIKKAILIFLIFCSFGISIYLVTQFVKDIMNFNFVKPFKEININDHKMIHGKWNSTWNIFKTLEFTNDSIVKATNQIGDTIKLNYLLNMKSLTIKDNAGLNLEFMIIKLSNSKLVLRDIQTMKENIEFSKQ